MVQVSLSVKASSSEYKSLSPHKRINYLYLKPVYLFRFYSFKQRSNFCVLFHSIPTTPFFIKGFFALWNGISAALLRQVLYMYTRFGIYEVGKQSLQINSFSGIAALAAIAGATGGFTGTPADKVNVRMQNDIKLPKEQRAK